VRTLGLSHPRWAGHMSNPNLRRTVWLTASQRQRLMQSTEEAVAHTNSTLAGELLTELQNTENIKESLSLMVQGTVRGLCLPTDILPVSICNAMADDIIGSGSLDSDLACLIRPQPRRANDE
jgi:hypothetical protein